MCRKTLPKVPETLLKKRKLRAEAKAKAVKAAVANKKVRFVLKVKSGQLAGKHECKPTYFVKKRIRLIV